MSGSVHVWYAGSRSSGRCGRRAIGSGSSPSVIVGTSGTRCTGSASRTGPRRANALGQMHHDPMSAQGTVVRDAPERSRYELVVGERVLGFADYSLDGRVITVPHVEV